MGYPTSYRVRNNPYNAPGGFQNAANDNTAPVRPYSPVRPGPYQVPTPANDNVSRRLRIAGNWSKFIRITRPFEVIKQISVINQEWQWFNNPNGTPTLVVSNYTITDNCGRPPVVFSLNSNHSCATLNGVLFPNNFQMSLTNRPSVFVTYYTEFEPATQFPGSGAILARKAARYQRNDSNTVSPVPYIKPGTFPSAMPVPEPLPQVWTMPDPLPRPGDVPVPRPVPYRVLPHWKPNPWSAPSERTTRGPRPLPNTDPFTYGRELSWDIGPGPNIKPRPEVNPFPGRQPPGDKTKEKKLIANVSASSVTGKFINITTETLDVLDAFYDALPKDLKLRGRPTPQAKAWHVYKNFDALNAEDVVKNLISNQIEDYLYGKLGQGAQRGAKPILDITGRPVGLGTGPAL